MIVSRSNDPSFHCGCSHPDISLGDVRVWIKFLYVMIPPLILCTQSLDLNLERLVLNLDGATSETKFAASPLP